MTGPCAGTVIGAISGGVTGGWKGAIDDVCSGFIYIWNVDWWSHQCSNDGFKYCDRGNSCLRQSIKYVTQKMSKIK